MFNNKDPEKLINEWLADVDSFALPSDNDIPSREYENKLIAWLDVLGMSKKILDSGESNTGAEEILTNIGKLRNCVESSCLYMIKQNKLDYIQLNDGFIIVSELEYIDELCEIICEIQWKILIDIKLLIRGAVTAGQIIVSSDLKIIIGPAFINALKMENEVAIFPRILFSEKIYQYIKKEDIEFPYIKEDIDHLKYLDYLKYEYDLEDNYINFDNKLKVFGIKKLLKKYYTDNIMENNNIAQKYGWVIKKLSDLKIKIIQ